MIGKVEEKMQGATLDAQRRAFIAAMRERGPLPVIPSDENENIAKWAADHVGGVLKTKKEHDTHRIFYSADSEFWTTATIYRPAPIAPDLFMRQTPTLGVTRE
eukprot:COSAG02_NODE_19075_length_901_cov_1.168329_1_plen_103_part_00